MQQFRPRRKLRASSGPGRDARLDITCLNMQRARRVEVPLSSLEYTRNRRKLPPSSGIDGDTSEPEAESPRTPPDNTAPARFRKPFDENYMERNDKIGQVPSKPGKSSNSTIVRWLDVHPPKPAGYEKLPSSPWTLDRTRLRRAWREAEKAGATVSDAGYKILSLTRQNIEFTMSTRGFRGVEYR